MNTENWKWFRYDEIFEINQENNNRLGRDRGTGQLR